MTDDGPRWLSAAEQRAWRAFLEATRLLFDGLERELERDVGMSGADYEILVQLSEAEGHTIRMRELAEQTRFSRSRLSHAVARLESRGWVARDGCPTDKRGTLANITGDGLSAMAVAAPLHVAAVRRYLFDALDQAQVDALEGISRAITERLSEAVPPGGCDPTSCG